MTAPRRLQGLQQAKSEFIAQSTNRQGKQGQIEGGRVQRDLRSPTSNFRPPPLTSASHLCNLRPIPFYVNIYVDFVGCLFALFVLKTRLYRTFVQYLGDCE